MATITCPNCGEVIEVDPSSVEDLTRQLRDELFEQDLQKRLADMGHTHEAELAAVHLEEQREADKRVAKAQAQMADLQARLDAASREAELTLGTERAAAAEREARLKAQIDAASQETELAVERQRAADAQDIAALQAKLDAATREGELERERIRAQAAEERARIQRDEELKREAAANEAAKAAERARTREQALQEEVTRLSAQLETQGAAREAKAEVDLLKATAELERQRGELESQLAVARANSEQAQASLREEMARREAEIAQRNEEQIEAKNAQIEQFKAELERLRDYRIRLSTKLIGESLERHCESEFNRIRMQAYPRASLFEMKNEEELSSATSRKRNEDHFKKLDADRTKKHCEYAVLVSTLEPDNDFYNAGIADVSWRYPKMFVVRPQCFTAIIGLLKAAALAAHPYRLQLERVRREEVDVTRFEDKVNELVGGIENDYALASKNYDRAVARSLPSSA